MVTPVGVANGGEGVVVVGAPLQSLEPHVTSEGDSIDDGLDEGVVGCMLREGGDVVEHAVRDHLLMFRYSFVLFYSIGHYFNVINIGLGWACHSAVDVQREYLHHVSLQGGVWNLYARDGISADERYHVACKYPVVPLQGQLGSTRIW